MLTHRPYLNVLAVAVALASTTAFAADLIPDAGSLERELAPTLQPQQQAPSVAVKTAAPQQNDENAERVLVKEFVVEGNQLISSEDLQAVLADQTGQEQTLQDLQYAARLVSDQYRKQGWFVQAFLPAQDVSDGTVRIQVIEAKIGQAHLIGDGSRLNADFVQRMVLQGMQSGEPLSAQRLERGVLLANDLAGVKASTVLEAGEGEGSTNINIKQEDTALVTADVGINNYGVKSTGKEQLVGGLALNDLSGYGDQLNLRLLAAEHLLSTSLGYRTPLGTNGLNANVYASHLTYELGGQYKVLDAKGSATTLGAGADWAWIRQSQHNLSLSAGLENRHYADDQLGAKSRRHQINVLNLGINGNIRDNRFGGSAVSWGSIKLSNGNLDINSVAADIANDKAGPKAAGFYSKLSFNANRMQYLGESPYRVLASLNGQLSSKNLSSSEQMSLGGPYGVRAFPVNEASGDQGTLLNLELQRHLPKNFLAGAFYDSGFIQQHHSTWNGWNGGSNQSNSYSLHGVGLSLGWAADGWNFSSALAVPVGGNPGKNLQGKNSDGSSPSEARLWASLSKAF